MKQRKPPFILAGILVVCLGIVVFIAVAFPKLTGQAAPEAEQPSEEHVIGEGRETPKPEELAKTVNNPEAKPEAEGAQPKKEGMSPMPGHDNGPSVLIRQAAVEKPQPTDSATATHWYDKEYRGPTKMGN